MKTNVSAEDCNLKEKKGLVGCEVLIVVLMNIPPCSPLKSTDVSEEQIVSICRVEE
jgi:hypothetical protein